MSATDVVLVDYGVGNLLSVRRALEHCGASVLVTSDQKKVSAARKVVLPGVGAFGNAMEALWRLGLVDALHEVAQRQVPFLGICLGMQLLLDESEEFGITKGLGLIPGRVVGIPTKTVDGQSQKIPHIGWSELYPSDASGQWHEAILEGTASVDAAYFVHSFMSVTDDMADQNAHCLFGGHRIPAVISSGPIVGCQFHPEKSGDVGLRILRQFISR